jgi:hypothetical protein
MSMAELRTVSVMSALAKKKNKYVWQNEGPAQIHASGLERICRSIPSSAVGGTLVVNLVDVSGLDGPHGLNPQEPPFVELQIGEMMQCSRAATPTSNRSTVAGRRHSFSSPGSNQVGLATGSFIQPQTFIFQDLRPALPPFLQVSIFSRKNGTCHRLVAIGHIMLNQIWLGGWHTLTCTLVSRAKGASPAHIRVNINFTAASDLMLPPSERPPPAMADAVGIGVSSTGHSSFFQPGRVEARSYP